MSRPPHIFPYKINAFMPILSLGAAERGFLMMLLGKHLLEIYTRRAEKSSQGNHSTAGRAIQFSLQITEAICIYIARVISGLGQGYGVLGCCFIYS